jgi:hypothetical protein
MKSPTTRSRQTKPLKKAFQGTQRHRERLEAGKMNFEWAADFPQNFSAQPQARKKKFTSPDRRILRGKSEADFP